MYSKLTNSYNHRSKVVKATGSGKFAIDPACRRETPTLQNFTQWIGSQGHYEDTESPKLDIRYQIELANLVGFLKKK